MALVDKAAISAEVDVQFRVARETFIDRNDPVLLAQVGDVKTPDKFIPQLKVMPWWNKAKFSVRARVDLSKPATVDTVGDKIVWSQGDRKVEFYKTTDPDMPDGVWKLDEIIQTRGTSNRIPYSIRFRNVVFHKQLGLDVEQKIQPDPLVVRSTSTHTYDENGNVLSSRPEWAINSYALYHSHKKHNEYKTGKFMHIKRPKIIDADGVEVWGDLNINEEAQLLEVIIPLDFWETAQYPLTVDPDFGHTTVGASSRVLASQDIHFATHVFGAEDGVVNTISVYESGIQLHQTVGFKLILLDSNGAILPDGIAPTYSLGMNEFGLWIPINYINKPTLASGSTYFLGIISILGGEVHVAFDSVLSAGGQDFSNSYWTPQDMISWSVRNDLFSIFCNYDIVGGGIGNNPISIFTSAKNSSDQAVLPSQVGIAANQIKFPDSFEATNNGSVAGPPTDGTPVYAGRWIIVRPEAVDEEIHYIESSDEITGIVTLSQDQVTPAQLGQTYRIAYGVTDADTAGVNFREIENPDVPGDIRPDDWVCKTQFVVAPKAGAPAGSKALFAMGQGQSLQTASAILISSITPNVTTTINIPSETILVDGDSVSLSNIFIPIGHTDINGTHVISNVTGTSFTIPVNTQTQGPYSPAGSYLLVIPQIHVKADGELIVGQENFNLAFSGADIISVAPTNGDICIGADEGSKVWLYDCYIKSAKRTHSYFRGTTIWRKVKWFSSGEVLDVTGSTTGTIKIEADCVIQGKRQFTEITRFSTKTNCIGPLSIINTGGLDTADDLITETIFVRRVTFVGNVRDLTVYAKKWWRLIGCIITYDPTTQDELSFPVNDANRVTIEHFLDVTVKTVAGVPIVGAKVFLYEGLRTGTVVAQGDTIAGGSFSGEFVEDDITYASPTTLAVQKDGDHFLKVYDYGNKPFIGAKGLNSDTVVVSSISDTDIIAADAATAITNGAGIVLTNPTNACSLIEWSSGAGTLAVGNTVSGASATGVVVEILEGDSVAGKAILDTRNTSAYVSVEAVSNGAGWTATLVDIAGSAEKRYSWRKDLASKSLQAAFDYQAAKFTESTLDAVWLNAVEWGEGEHSLLLQKSGATYVTERNVNLSEGVILTNRGAGAIGHMTADDGYQYVPPSTTMVTYTRLKDNSEVRVYDSNTGEEIAGIEDAMTGTTDDRSFAWSGSAGLVVNYVIHCFQPGDEIYETIRVNGYTVPSADVTLPVNQRLDRNAQN